MYNTKHFYRNMAEKALVGGGMKKRVFMRELLQIGIHNWETKTKKNGVKRKNIKKKKNMVIL